VGVGIGVFEGFEHGPHEGGGGAAFGGGHARSMAEAGCGGNRPPPRGDQKIRLNGQGERVMFRENLWILRALHTGPGTAAGS
jgi:hypothetical protein